MNRQAATAWLKAAYDDIYLLNKIWDDRHLTAIASFHAQQCCEKTLKAILEYHDQDVPKVHSLRKLFALAKPFADLRPDKAIIAGLDTLYIEARYPGDFGLLPHGKPTIEDVKVFFQFAQDVFDTACRQLEIGREDISG